jgi:hypothetical protein
MKMLIDNLSEDELQELLGLMRDFKNLFARVTGIYIDEARRRRLPDETINTALADEMLKLAACFHFGEAAEFIACAHGALEFAARARSKEAMQ